MKNNVKTHLKADNSILEAFTDPKDYEPWGFSAVKEEGQQPMHVLCPSSGTPSSSAAFAAPSLTNWSDLLPDGDAENISASSIMDDSSSVILCDFCSRPFFTSYISEHKSIPFIYF